MLRTALVQNCEFGNNVTNDSDNSMQRKMENKYYNHNHNHPKSKSEVRLGDMTKIHFVYQDTTIKNFTINQYILPI